MTSDAATRGGLALARQAQLDAFVGTWRDLDRHRLLGAHHTPTLTLAARVGNDLTLAIAPIAQGHVDELTKDRLLHAANLAAAFAPGALGPLAIGLHAAARTARTVGVLGQTDLFARPEDRLFKRE